MAKELINLGELYVSDFVKQTNGQPKHELKIIMDEEVGAPRIEKPAPLDIMYGKYWYRSGINATMKDQLGDVVSSILPLIKCKAKDIWLDIACNDGTLLSKVPESFTTVGFDPAEDSFLNESRSKADVVIPDYFSAKMYKSMMRDHKAKIITTISMFYDLADPVGFCREVYDIMDDEGLWVIQLSYTPLMLQQLAFDNICHEHIYYHSFSSMTNVLREAGMKIVDCTLNDTNGGSFRLYIRKSSANEKGFSTQAMRDVANFRCSNLHIYESNVDWAYAWQKFAEKVGDLKSKLIGFITEQKRNKKTIMGYGASTKGNTLLQYFGLNSKLITAIADRNPDKIGLKTIGTDIPIISEEEMRKAKPDYLLILPWHFIDSFEKRESEYLKNGGHFIVPCPKLVIV